MASKRRVLIIGGGLAGLTAARELRKRFRVTVVDAKEYYEFTSGIFRAYVDPTHWERLSFLYKEVLEGNYGVRFVWGEVTDLTVQQGVQGKSSGLYAIVQPAFSTGLDVVEFDYCLIANGCHWNPFSPTGESPWVPTVHCRNREGSAHRHLDERFMDGRRHRILEEHQALADMNQAAENVLVVGAGFLGVQWACEMQHHFPSLKVMVLDFMPRCLGPLNKDAAAHCQSYMDQVGIECRYGVKYNPEWPDFWNKLQLPHKVKTYVLSGVKHSNYFMPQDTRSDRGPSGGGWISHNQYMQVVAPSDEDGEPERWAQGRIFTVGDCTHGVVGALDKPTLPPLPKTGYTASELAVHACRNIVALDQHFYRQQGCCAPSMIRPTWYPWGSGIFVISLGDSDGCTIIGANHEKNTGRMKYKGLVCVAQKELIESTKMAQLKGDHRIARCLWFLVHHWPINCCGRGPPCWCICT